MPDTLPITVAIPTYRREAILLATLDVLLSFKPAPGEVLVLDQTEKHEDATEERLRTLTEAGSIRWFRLPEPSIPRSMNRGLLEAQENIILFLDDDVRPEPDLLLAHARAHDLYQDVLVAGRVIQPWQEGKDFSNDSHFHFASTRSSWVKEFIGCNFSVNRHVALTLGGFDENFVRVAYRFEAEFSYRYLESGHRIWFEPTACLHHLKVNDGGTRTYGEHLTTWKPDHAVGAYYYGLRTASFRKMLLRPFRSVATRHHLRRPWWIPVTLMAELSGLAWAILLYFRGPRYCSSSQTT
jgi:GT2 family glycosyltransferase